MKCKRCWSPSRTWLGLLAGQRTMKSSYDRSSDDSQVTYSKLQCQFFFRQCKLMSSEASQMIGQEWVITLILLACDTWLGKLANFWYIGSSMAMTQYISVCSWNDGHWQASLEEQVMIGIKSVLTENICISTKLASSVSLVKSAKPHSNALGFVRKTWCNHLCVVHPSFTVTLSAIEIPCSPVSSQLRCRPTPLVGKSSSCRSILCPCRLPGLLLSLHKQKGRWTYMACVCNACMSA